MKKNILSVVLSIAMVFNIATKAIAENFESELFSVTAEISDAPLQRNIQVISDELLSPAIERFNIAESINEIPTTDTSEDNGSDIPHENPSVLYSETDLYWLSRIIEAEASGESYTGKIAVGNCVINRTKSNEFPNSIYGVIFDTKHGVQYQPIANGSIYNTPSEESILAAKDALNGHSVVGNALYFCSTKVAPYSWASKNRKYLTTIGNHVFYL